MIKKAAKVTITDVAEACGVSIKTVSRVINNSENVSEKTRNKVNRAIEELGYKTNILARGLKGNNTGVIMVITDRHEEEHLSAWHTLMLRFLFSYARKRDMKVILSPSSATNYTTDDADGYYLLEHGMVDGVIFLEHVPNDPRCQDLKEKGIPFVLFGETDDESVWSISMDNFNAGFKGGHYLASRGYRNIWMLVGDLRFNSNEERARGFEDAMNDAGCSYNIRDKVTNQELAYRVAKDILESNKVDAFFISGDERAPGIYRAIYEKGLRIPDDVAVLGIDNIPLGNYMQPRLSTIDQDFDIMAKGCIDFLMRQINGEDLGIKKKVTFLPSIVERDSTFKI